MQFAFRKPKVTSFAFDLGIVLRAVISVRVLHEIHTFLFFGIVPPAIEEYRVKIIDLPFCMVEILQYTTKEVDCDWHMGGELVIDSLIDLSSPQFKASFDRGDWIGFAFSVAGSGSDS